MMSEAWFETSVYRSCYLHPLFSHDAVGRKSKRLIRQTVLHHECIQNALAFTAEFANCTWI